MSRIPLSSSVRPRQQTLPILALCALLSLPFNRLLANQLPLLGDTSSAIVTLEEERRLGNAWVRVLRAQAPLLDDPITISFVQELLQQLAIYSPLQDRRLTLVVVANNNLNAFAVPGGIIGVNSGLFLYAGTESEFASVLAHELSHLSQRHYAQGLAEDKRSLPARLATTMAGILLLATTNGQAGAAAIIGGQAAAMERRLAYSRSNEQEADRVGMQVLVDAGYEPESMPRMFSQLQRSIANLGRKPPEFLLTHPVTESRIADALNRSSQLPRGGRVNSLRYQLIRTRVQVMSIGDNNAAYKRYLDALDAGQETESVRYGIALSALRSQRYEEARQQIDLLLEQHPNELILRLLQTELWIEQQQAEQAVETLQQLLDVYPQNHPITMQLAQALHQLDRQAEVIALLENQSRVEPNDIQLWYELAEAYGLNNNIKGVHLARAEYFLLKGALPKATKHLELALKQPDLSEHERLRVEQRVKEAEQLKKDMEF
ncbi:M48 family peptidase [Motiliproteus coralliicola]|uniref:Putative beta-barrel assembly-enhancing protease n=1 Tax=Motiliproteus coralliicola TaxID=2283196 RepID=A0A369WT70_9GAMM|nr:M48 family metalloprotease [Motiliproteus coralliicola]RDE24259.1 M48 family peptidase [Motiliproteus coralliicola]